MLFHKFLIFFLSFSIICKLSHFEILGIVTTVNGLRLLRTVWSVASGVVGNTKNVWMNKWNKPTWQSSFFWKKKCIFCLCFCLYYILLIDSYLWFVFFVAWWICSLMSDYLQPHGLQQARLLCPSPSPRVSSNSCPLSQYCQPTISSLEMRSWSLLLPSIIPSVRLFSNESVVHIRWPKYWNFSISPYKEYLRFISFRIDWFRLLAVQETLKNFHQHHNSKTSIFLYTAFFMVRLSHTYTTAGKTIALTVDICWQSTFYF